VITGFLRRLGIGGSGDGAKGGTGRSGRTSAAVQADRDLFLDAMQETVPDFARFCLVANDDDAETALRTLYAGLPPVGRGSRVAVVRCYLLKKAAEDGDAEDETQLGRLSEKQLAQVARRAGIPI